MCTLLVPHPGETNVQQLLSTVHIHQRHQRSQESRDLLADLRLRIIDQPRREGNVHQLTVVGNEGPREGVHYRSDHVECAVATFEDLVV